MKFRSFLSCAVFLVYLILLILFSVYEKNPYDEIHNAQYKHNCLEFSCISFCDSAANNYSNNSLKEAYKGIANYKPSFFGGFKDEENITVYRNDLKCHYFQRKIIDEDMKNVDLSYVSLKIAKIIN